MSLNRWKSMTCQWSWPSPDHDIRAVVSRWVHVPSSCLIHWTTDRMSPIWATPVLVRAEDPERAGPDVHLHGREAEQPLPALFSILKSNGGTIARSGQLRGRLAGADGRRGPDGDGEQRKGKREAEPPSSHAADDGRHGGPVSPAGRTGSSPGWRYGRSWSRGVLKQAFDAASARPDAQILAGRSR